MNQAVNMLFAQIDFRRALPFPITLTDEIAPPMEHVRENWANLDKEDFAHLIRSK
jgi:hypothetical protein